MPARYKVDGFHPRHPVGGGEAIPTLLCEPSAFANLRSPAISRLFDATADPPKQASGVIQTQIGVRVSCRSKPSHSAGGRPRCRPLGVQGHFATP